MMNLMSAVRKISVKRVLRMCGRLSQVNGFAVRTRNPSEDNLNVFVVRERGKNTVDRLIDVDGVAGFDSQNLFLWDRLSGRSH